MSMVCIPFKMDDIAILGEDGGPRSGKADYQRSATGVRYGTYAVVFEQAGAGADYIGPAVGAGGYAVNLFGGGSAVGDTPGDDATPLGYRTGAAPGTAIPGFGVLTTRETNFYPGGRPCPSNMEFVMCAFGVRPMPLWMPGLSDIDGATGELIYGAELRIYQDQIQQAVLDDSTFTFRKFDDSCLLDITSAPHAPDPNSSGMPEVSSQNGTSLRYNVNPLCKCLVIGNRDDTRANANFTVTLQRRLHERLSAIGGGPAVDGRPIVAEFQVDMWGYCRYGCREDLKACIRDELGRVICRTVGNDIRAGLCGPQEPSAAAVAQAMREKVPG